MDSVLFSLSPLFFLFKTLSKTMSTNFLFLSVTLYPLLSKCKDSFLLMEKFTHTGKESVSLLGVFDGHGPEGGGVSAFCRDNVSWVLQDCSVQVCV